MTRRPAVLIPLSLLLASTSLALPPGHAPALREGANHHLGDGSFVAAFGRAPTKRDSERVRMTTHLKHVRTWLTSRPATKPELADKRAKLLAHLDDYIAKGTTPENANLPWRTPVFIDDAGTICAVGYLIEQSVGRALPETIAKRHRYDFIEDIAADMPEVAAWVEASGMTLEEIGSIQPAYEDPEVESWKTWDLAKYPPPDGRSTRYGNGMFKNRKMEGEWTVGKGDDVLGRGKLTRGNGRWTSFYATGEKMGEGRYVANQPSGPWKLYHRSGNLAAEGSFSAGDRMGKWRFYYDTPAKTPIAVGRFSRGGYVAGRWRHFDADGKLIARSWTETPTQWADRDLSVNGGEGAMLDVLPGADRVAHQIHQGTIGKDVEAYGLQLESFTLRGERLYIQRAFNHETMFGADGTKLEHADDGTWTASDCGWGAKRKAIAAAGDVPRLHGVLYNDAHTRVIKAKGPDEYSAPDDPGPTCRKAVTIDKRRATRLDEILASRDRVRAVAPAFVRKLVLRQEDDVTPDDADKLTPEEELRTGDLTRVLAGNMAMYIEWPHIDRRFKELYGTMAGRFNTHWWDATESDADVREAPEN